jgi:hypothetical protein
MSDYISVFQASCILKVSKERISWFIFNKILPTVPSPRHHTAKLILLQDIYRILEKPELLAPWIINKLVDPRDNTVRYIGQTNEPQPRFRQHLNSDPVSNPAKYDWIHGLKKVRLLPRQELVEGVYASRKVLDERESYWISYYLNQGAPLTNLDMGRINYN